MQSRLPSPTRKPEHPFFVEFTALSSPAKKRAGCAFGVAERTVNSTNGQTFLKAGGRQSELRRCLETASDVRLSSSFAAALLIALIQDQVARFDSQRGATCKVDANTLLCFA
jgi:hypothetical protein